MKNIDTEITLDDVNKLNLDQFEEVAMNIRKLQKQPSSCIEAEYRHILVDNPGWELPDGTKHLRYTITYQTKKEKPLPKPIKVEEYNHEQISELLEGK